MTGSKDPSLAAAAEAELPWLQRYIPLTRRVAADLSRATLRDRHIGLNVHLDIKMVPVVEALIQTGAQVVVLEGRTVYLLAKGAMLNLTAGFGDPVDAFDLTSALMLAGIEFIVQHHAAFPAGIHLLPSDVQHRIALLAAGPLSPSR